MDYTRKEVIEMILKHLNIRLSLDKIYENYTNGKYLNGEPLPEFITQWDSDCSIEMCCPLNEECDRCI